MDGNENGMTRERLADTTPRAQYMVQDMLSKSWSWHAQFSYTEVGSVPWNFLGL